jgi:hypothetical protein
VRRLVTHRGVLRHCELSVSHLPDGDIRLPSVIMSDYGEQLDLCLRVLISGYGSGGDTDGWDPHNV